MGRAHPGAGASGLKPLMAVFMALAILSLCLFFGVGITNASRALAQTSDPAPQGLSALAPASEPVGSGTVTDPAPQDPSASASASAPASAPASEPVGSGTVTDPAPASASASASASAPASEPVGSGTVTAPDPVYSEPDP